MLWLGNRNLKCSLEGLFMASVMGLISEAWLKNRAWRLPGGLTLNYSSSFNRTYSLIGSMNHLCKIWTWAKFVNTVYFVFFIGPILKFFTNISPHTGDSICLAKWFTESDWADKNPEHSLPLCISLGFPSSIHCQCQSTSSWGRGISTSSLKQHTGIQDFQNELELCICDVWTVNRHRRVVPCMGYMAIMYAYCEELMKCRGDWWMQITSYVHASMCLPAWFLDFCLGVGLLGESDTWRLRHH